MTHHWDEFSKALAEKTVPRRQTLRLLGAGLAGAFLSPLGVRIAWAGARDPCREFCRCRSKSQQSDCLAACRSCDGDTSRLCGTCGSYVCCAAPGPFEFGACVEGQCSYWCAEGAADCGDGCTPLWADPDNCGACGNVCPESAPYCSDGACSESPCAPGLTLCDGACVNLAADYFHCGACGHSCEGIGEYCDNGTCNNYPFPLE